MIKHIFFVELIKKHEDNRINQLSINSYQLAGQLAVGRGQKTEVWRFNPER